MPQNGFSIGRDMALDVITSAGPLRLGLPTNFVARQETTEQRVKGMDGINRPLRFFEGWSGSFDLERLGPELDKYFVQLEASYYAGFNEGPATITETITEPDGTVSQFTYTGVVLSLEDSGSWSGSSTVKQRLKFMAQRKIERR